MQRRVLSLVVLAASVIAQAQTKLAVSMNGHPAGVASISQHIQKDGVKVVELRMELTSNNRQVALESQDRYDAKGLPTRKFLQTVMPAGALNRQIVATFNKDGANVVVLDGDKRTVKSVPLASLASRTNLSEFWFIRDMPKPSSVEQAYQFNMDTLEWENVKTEFRGKKTLKIDGHSIPVYEVVSSRGATQSATYFDLQGLPVLVDLGNVKMVKIWPK